MEVGGGLPRELFLFALQLDLDERAVLPELVPCGNLPERCAGLQGDDACVCEPPECDARLVLAVWLVIEVRVESLACVEERSYPEFTDGVK